MSTYLFGEEVVHKTDPTFNERLAAAYRSKARPACCCRHGSGRQAAPERMKLEMYIVRFDDRYYLKRMPDTGPNHDPSCLSYEPPPELSGLGQVAGAAIIESAAEGRTTLKLDFALSKAAPRSAPAPGAANPNSAQTDGTKLTLRALLHYLWDQAGFSKWSPMMSGRRNWGVMRKYLLRAAESKQAKGKALAELLYIPEPYTQDQRDGIAQRRVARLSSIAETSGRTGARQLMLMLAEVKAISPARNGYKLLVKHVPDYFFVMDQELHQRLQQRFELELSLWDAFPGTHLLLAATFGVNRAGVASIHEIALMAATENWIPFESGKEKVLLDALTKEERRFVKSMRYNLPLSVPLATAVLTDTQAPTALYLNPACADEDYSRMLDELIHDSRLASWVWSPDRTPIPAFPCMHKPVQH